MRNLSKNYFSKRYFFALLITFCCVISEVVQAQDEARIGLRETGVWNGVYLKVRISKKLGYYGEHHYRTRNSIDNLYDFVGRTRQVYNRAGLNIFFSPYFEAVIGPTLVFNFTPIPGDPNLDFVVLEPRIWHQWLFMMPSLGRFKIYHQFRFEHRWKKSNVKESEFDYTNRYRYKFFAYVPLNNKKIVEKTWFVSPSFEIFMHTGKNIVFNPFEDFRTYNGVGYVLNKKVTFFAGHMWTLGQNPDGFSYSTSHIIRLNVFIGFDARAIDQRIPSINLGF